MMQEDELAILGDYCTNDEREKRRDAKDVILEYDEYEKQLLNEICGDDVIGLADLNQD